MTKSTQKRNQRRRPRSKATTQITRAVRDLQLTTQQVVLPDVRDIVPTPINRRQLYTFERSYTENFTGPGIQIIQPTLGDFPNFTEFTTLFQKYRFLWFTVEFQATMNVPVTGYASDSAVFSAIVSPVPAAVSDLQQLETYQNHGSPLNMVKIKRSFTPHTFIDNGTPAVGQLSPQVRAWYTTDYTTQQFFGCYVNIVGGSATSVAYIVRAAIQFMNPV